MEISYKIKTASEDSIYRHLMECNTSFVPPLSEKVNINDYSKKLHEKSVTFEAWANNNHLIGLIACYYSENNAFITNVSALSSHSGKGIASQLMINCIDYSKKQNCTQIKLEVNKLNSNAIHLYNKFGFTIFEEHSDSLIMRFEL